MRRRTAADCDERGRLTCEEKKRILYSYGHFFLGIRFKLPSGVRAGERRLHAFLESVAVSEEMVRTLCDAPLDEKFVEAVVALNRKIAFLRTNVPLSRGAERRDSAARARAHSAAAAAGAPVGPAADLSWLSVAPCKTKAAEDTAPQIEKLRLKVVTRVREGMLERFQQLRAANTNLQLIQTSTILKFAPCITFLAEHAPSLAVEVQQHYVAVMSRTLFLLYRKYHADLKVSVLLFTVTFYANHAHNLTRSP